MPKEIILRPSKFKHIRISITSFILAACSVSSISEHPLIGWTGVLLFGGGGIFLLIQLLSKSSQLRLTEDGFEVSSMGKRTFTTWGDVSEFFVLNTTQNGLTVNSLVGYNNSAQYQKQELARSISHALTKCEGALPDTYGMSAADLAALMTDWKHGVHSS